MVAPWRSQRAAANAWPKLFFDEEGGPTKISEGILLNFLVRTDTRLYLAPLITTLQYTTEGLLTRELYFPANQLDLRIRPDE